MTSEAPVKHAVRVQVNERQYEEEVEGRRLLVHFLRETLGLTGTHVGCVVGECGACSVLLDGSVVKSCLVLAVQADGRAVVTIEGLERNGSLHPLQESFVSRYGLQCGYCTPGMILTALDLLARNPRPTEDDIRHGLAGNLCMCTGYMQIVEAVREAATVLAGATPDLA
ncbi:MAG: 2Fe-2S iron-sulfur cluster binding domain-containing protein [Chloroflexi bacterium]|nr:2Fe-2S iron-sulfur cluster binding domain-containing protein [Chloroflexota bacterium]